jgi:7,8-dihydropterin-6-yl-methyl-4-(beta-D-ribofuranosyl)aminobenzene 5'-phosphate synthase
MIALLIVIGAVVALLLLLFFLMSVRFLVGRRKAKVLWNNFVAEKLTGLGSVESLKITPLIDWYVAEETLAGEAGVSWLVQADDKNILMDVGLNLGKEHPSPLLRNMKNLNVDLQEIQYLFISHRHLDHTGGMAAQKNRTFTPSAEQVDLSRLTAFVPVPMVHPEAKVQLIEKPQVLMPGVASEGPIATSMFGMGLTREQALVVNVAGKGLVLIVGCGHQGLRRIVERAEKVFNEPIYGLVGGLHFPVTASRLVRMGLPMQKFLGTGKWPWQNITKGQVRESIAFLKSKNLKLVSISAHDSCDWTLQEFRNAFKGVYRELKVGLPLVIG